jgi:CRP/FNR family cyclic AMP-dependent transcriptional regulator
MTTAFQPLFSELSQDDLRFVSDHGITRFYPKRAIVVTEGGESEAFFFILEGRIKIYVSEREGKEAILSIEGPGEYFGELSLIDNSPRSASAITLEPSYLSVVSRANFERCFVERPSLALKLIRSLAFRVRSLTDEVKHLSLHDVYGRLSHTLLKLAEDKEGKLMIEQPLTHQDLASMVGASREMVSRIMKDLTTGRYISVKNRKITIDTKLPAAW